MTCLLLATANHKFCHQKNVKYSLFMRCGIADWKFRNAFFCFWILIWFQARGCWANINIKAESVGKLSSATSVSSWYHNNFRILRDLNFLNSFFLNASFFFLKVCGGLITGGKVCLAIVFSILGFLALLPALFWTFIYKWFTSVDVKLSLLQELKNE